MWARFKQNNTSGKVGMVLNFIKGYEVSGSGKKNLVVVANAVNGRLSEATMFPTVSEKYTNSKRADRLV